MIEFIKGNILMAEAQALVNTVNTYGVMGNGIALAFKKSFPNNYKEYRKAFDDEQLKIGRMFVHKTGQLRPEIIINFPTKKHWRHKSKMEYIENGLDDLINVIKKYEISSIAIPPLGCGNGGLNWTEVKALILEKLEGLNDTQIILYEPGFELKIRGVKALNKLNPTRAIYLTLVRQFGMLGEQVTTLALQKLAYLLQLKGEKLNLRFEKGLYGPYSNNLN